MECNVWQLRRDGVKLPADALDGPHRGFLRLTRYNIAGLVSLHADLRLGAGQGAPSALLGMSQVEVRRLDERGMLLYGLQSEPTAGPAGPRHRQAWFCQIDTTTADSDSRRHEKGDDDDGG